MLQSSNPTFIIAFVAGLLSFISPCVLPLYPSYLSYITGISYDEMHADGDRSLVRRRSLMHSLFFCLGFSIIFVALGFTSSMVGTLFLDYSTLIRQIGAILIIVMGLFLSGLLKIDFLYKQAKFQLKSKPVGYLGAVVVGISFAAGWTPCIGPILASVLAIAASNPVSGVSLMLFYSIGFALPFLILAYTLGSVRWLLRYSEIISRIGGFGLILMGILLFTNAMTSITTWLIRIFGGFTGF